MVKFIYKIIWYSILEQRLTIIIDKALSALSNETNNEFLQKFEEDSNTIAAKTQLYFTSHNATSF